MAADEIFHCGSNSVVQSSKSIQFSRGTNFLNSIAWSVQVIVISGIILFMYDGFALCVVFHTTQALFYLSVFCINIRTENKWPHLEVFIVVYQ